MKPEDVISAKLILPLTLYLLTRKQQYPNFHPTRAERPPRRQSQVLKSFKNTTSNTAIIQPPFEHRGGRLVSCRIIQNQDGYTIVACITIYNRAATIPNPPQAQLLQLHNARKIVSYAVVGYAGYEINELVSSDEYSRHTVNINVRLTTRTKKRALRK